VTNEEAKRRVTDGAVPRKAELMVSGMLVTRLSYDGTDLPPVAPNETSDAFNVIVQLADFRHHKLWRNGDLLFEGGHLQGATAITDLRDEWQCHHLSPFDNIRFHVPFSYIKSFAEKAGRLEFTGLIGTPGMLDDVMLGLAQSLVPALETPQNASKLFLDQIALATLAHLTQFYGGVHFPNKRKGTLALWQEKRAAEFLSAHVNADFSVSELATACELSRSYFIKAFKETFGKTPYQWLMEYRVVRARDLLQSDMALAEIAVACGFSDQSHMTKVFSKMTGKSPGAWRRRNRFG
jgi:AraC-like DNA-binding protein